MDEFSHGPKIVASHAFDIQCFTGSPRSTLYAWTRIDILSAPARFRHNLRNRTEDNSPTTQYDRTMKFIAGLLFILASSSPGFAEPHPIKDEVKGSVGLVILSRAVRT